MIYRLFTVLSSLFVLMSLSRAEGDPQTLLQIEQTYLDERAKIFSAMATQKADVSTAKNQIIQNQWQTLRWQTQADLENLLPKLSGQINNQAAHYKFVSKMVAKDSLKQVIPFKLTSYLTIHTFETYNTFSVPVEKRKLVNLQFKSDGWQYTDGQQGQYQYTLESLTSFRRSRPLKGGGTGTDVIHYNPLLNRFEKNKNLFMWIAGHGGAKK